MSSYDEEMVTVIDGPLVERRTYRFLMYLGLIAMFGSIVVYLLELVIYPQYIHTMLTDGLLPALVFNVQLNSVHSMNSLILLFMGLGFLGVFAKHGRKSGYLFLLVLILPLIIHPQFMVDFIIGVTAIDESLVWSVAIMGPAIGTSVILAFLLYQGLGSISNKRFIGLVSLTFVASQVAYVVWRFVTQHLAPVYDLMHFDVTQWTVTGSIENAMFITMPRIVGAIVCAIIFAAFLIYEIRTDDYTSGELQQEKEMIDDTSMEIVISK